MKTYYVILLNGMPVGVTSYYPRAKVMAAELTTPGKEATILPCAEVSGQTEFDFEEPTDLDIERPTL